MNLIEKMDEESECPETIFKEVIEKKRKYCVLAFYEGDDDANYYESRISVFIGTNTSFPFKCKGKKNVLVIHDLLKSNNIDLSHNKTLFFVDHDFEKNKIYPEDVYVTPCYAIENLYFTDNAFEKILHGFYKIESLTTEDDIDFNNALNYLKRQRDEYIKEMLFSNAFYSLQIDKKEKTGQAIDLSPIKNFNDIKGITNISELETKIKHPFGLKTKEIKAEMAYLSTDPTKLLRGKYFEQAMINDFKQLVEFCNNPNKSNGLFLKKRKNKTQLCEDNLLIVFSAFADTPTCLSKYLQKNLNFEKVA